MAGWKCRQKKWVLLQVSEMAPETFYFQKYFGSWTCLRSRDLGENASSFQTGLLQSTPSGDHHSFFHIALCTTLGHGLNKLKHVRFVQGFRKTIISKHQTCSGTFWRNPWLNHLKKPLLNMFGFLLKIDYEITRTSLKNIQVFT